MSRTQNVCVNKSITKILLNRASEVAQTIRTKNNIKRLKSTGGGGKGTHLFSAFSSGGLFRCSWGLLHVCVQEITAIFGFKNGSCYFNKSYIKVSKVVCFAFTYCTEQIWAVIPTMMQRCTCNFAHYPRYKQDKMCLFNHVRRHVVDIYLFFAVHMSSDYISALQSIAQGHYINRS